MNSERKVDYIHLEPREMRVLIRKGEWTRSTVGCCSGFTQANVVIIPARYAFYFLFSCHRNPKPCPVLEVMEEGDPEPKRFAPGADMRVDCCKYRVFQEGRMQELKDISHIWRDVMVTFLLGCSFTFEPAVTNSGLSVRHIEEGKNVPMYVTNLPCDSAGPFHGNLVVSMRPIPSAQISRAVQITSRYPGIHGARVYGGNPKGIGIGDLSRPDFGDVITVYPGEMPVVWACGVTSQVALLAAQPELAITHAPGHMFITDHRQEKLAVI